MVFVKTKKTIVFILSLPLTILGAASSSSDSHSIKRENTELHALAERAITQRDSVQWLRAIIGRKHVDGNQILDQQDIEGFRPFDCALRLFYRLSDQEREEKKTYFYTLFEVLRPECTTSEQQTARDISHGLLSGNKVKRNKALVLFRDASPAMLASIKEQFKYLSGHYLDTTLYEKLGSLLNECILGKLKSDGDEKSNAVGLLSYLLSSYWQRSKVMMTQDKIDQLLGQAVVCETSLPSFVPDLLLARADPCRIMEIKKNVHGSAFQAALANLLKIPSKRDIAGRHLFAMVRMGLPKEEIKLLKSKLGDLDAHVASGAFPEHYHVWLQLSKAIGANLEALRFLVFPLLKAKIDNKIDYMALKEVRSVSKLSPFEKFTLACLVCEFTACIASSMDGNVVYDLNRYTQKGDLVLVAKDKDWHTVDAERFRNKLNKEGNELVRHMRRKLYQADTND